MLGEYPAATMIPAKDLAKTRRFYEDVLGFSIYREDPGGITYQSGPGGTSRFSLYPTEAAGTAEHTLILWLVDDLEAVVDRMAAKGVTFERYEMTNDKGIAEMGPDAKAAWFKDPEGNLLSVWEAPGY